MQNIDNQLSDSVAVKKKQDRHRALRPFDDSKLPPPQHSLPENLHGSSFFLEIGAGNARHAVDWAQNNKKELLVAIERTKAKSTKAGRRIDQAREEIPNLIYVRDDAVNWVTHNLHQACLKGVFILYPNPYPKECQRNKRFHFMPFMRLLSDRMLPDAQLTLATNEPSYFLDACQMLPRHFDLVLNKQKVLDPRLPPRTNFEEVFFERNILCYEAVFRKLADSAPN